MTTSSGPGRGHPKIHPYVRTGLMTLGLVTGIALFVLAFTTSGDDTGNPAPAELENIEPSHQALITPQGEVGVDLDNTYTGVLLIDGEEIPEDQIVRIDPLSQVFFQPGAGKDIESFRAGVHSATVVYWPKSLTRDQSQAYTWLFRVG